MVDDETRGTRAAPGEPTADGTLTDHRDRDPDPRATTGEQTIIPTWGSTTFASLPAPGYQLGMVIGRGGMGEVVVAQDQRIGREVAVKRIRSRQPSDDQVTRFLREARIQARLDHPAIVPVYELGTDEDGRPFFTMKRLAGVTLAKRLSEGGPIQAMLRAFIGVCHAIQLAHSRGVIHRDLKPSNIMLGDYGEVYVLDWGVARVLTDRRRTTNPAMLAELDEGTTAGAILGTPGYMAPEQIKGHEVGTPADVYALGSILFEILSGESLHPRGGEAALASTLTHPQEAPTRRVLEKRAIPPELDGVCYEALAEEPEARPSARELADRVQAYLDGDRDVERRRALAAEQLVLARASLATTGDDARANAMRRAGRALALDPESTEAAELVSRLILEPPKQMPPDLVGSLDDEERQDTRQRGRNAAVAYGSIFLFVPLIAFLDVRNWLLLGAFYGLIALLVALYLSIARRGNQALAMALALNFLGVLVFSRLGSPLVLTPTVVMAMLLSFTAAPQLIEHPWKLFAWSIATVMMPFALEWVDVLPTTWTIKNGMLLTTSEFFNLHGRVEEAALVVANLGFILIGASFALNMHRRRRAAQRQLQVQAWHLRQLLPGDARAWQTSDAARSPLR